MKKTLLVALIFGASLVLTACGSNNNSTTTSTFNGNDVSFSQDMIPHHRQAVEMAKLADTRAASADVKALVKAIEGAQDPEIATMEGWLKGWNKKVPDASMSGMDHGADAMPGMMSGADMASLTGSSGTGFDMMFLTMMTAHHQGAITMAETEIAKGKNADAIALAKAIKTAQTREIATMSDLLKQ